MADFRVPNQKCPHCGVELNTAGTVPADKTERAPRPGDITLCLHCTAPLVFEQGLTVRILEPIELATMDASELAEIFAMKRTVEGLQAWNKANMN